MKSFLAEHFSKSVAPGAIVHGTLRDEAGVIDDPVVALAADSSYADITLHGGAWVVEAAIECAQRAGFVRRDSLSPRSAFPDSVDLLDAELQLALPLVRTELAARCLLSQPQAWREWIESTPGEGAIREVLNDPFLRHLLHPPTVVIIGLPNAGKSTLANQLFGTDRSIVSPIAGTTRDWVGEEANLDGLIIKLLDTPGRHETSDPIERQAIAQSDSMIQAASLAIILLDASRDFESQAHLLDVIDLDRVVVANKMDVATSEWSAAFLEEKWIVPIVAQRVEAVTRISKAIRLYFDPLGRPIDAARCWTSRQEDVLEASISDPSILRSLADGA